MTDIFFKRIKKQAKGTGVGQLGQKKIDILHENKESIGNFYDCENLFLFIHF